MEDRLDVGGTGGLDSYDMERSTYICGHTKKPGNTPKIGTEMVLISLKYISYFRPRTSNILWNNIGAPNV